MNLGTSLTVLRKELLETVRDRRTMMIMLVVPAFMYPALFILLQQLALFGQRSLEADPVTVAVVGAAPADLGLAGDSMLRVQEAGSRPLDALRAGALDAVVSMSPPPAGENGSRDVRVFYDASRDRSRLAQGIVDSRVQARKDTLLVRRLQARGLPRSFAAPLEVSDTSVASPRRLGGYTLGRFLPIVLILMMVLGAFYPAIDMAAGEKERGTLEPLLTVPVPEDEIVAGKFAAVTLVALAAAVLNLASMVLTFQTGLFQFGRAADIRFELPFGALLLTLLAMILLAVLFSSLFLGVAVRAQSFKEAQNALTPVYTVSFLPAMLSMIPGIAFTPAVALVPVAGVALLFRALLIGDADFLPAALAIASTLAYAMLALVFAVRAFGREEVLFGGSGAGEVAEGTMGERLLGWRQRATGMPGPAAALLLVSTVGLLTFYAGVPLQATYGERGLLLSQLLLIGLPALLFAWLGPFDLRAALALRPIGGRSLAAAILLMAGGLPIGWMLGWLQTFVLKIPEEFLGNLQGLLTAATPQRLAWLLLLVAVTPAICEELVFRGVLLQGLAKEWTMPRAVAVSALVFGAFHLSFETAIRFLPTLWLGLLFGYVVWHTRSLYASMLMHFLNNAVAVLLVSSVGLQGLVTTASGEPKWEIMLVSLPLFVAGLLLLPRRPLTPHPPTPSPTEGREGERAVKS